MEPGTPEPAAPSLCSACGAPFRCGAEAGEPRCWCFELPKLAAISGSGCLCRDCLGKALKAESGAYRT